MSRKIDEKLAKIGKTSGLQEARNTDTSQKTGPTHPKLSTYLRVVHI